MEQITPTYNSVLDLSMEVGITLGSSNICVGKIPGILIQNSLFQGFMEGILSLHFGTRMTTDFLSIFLIPKPILHLFDPH